MSPGGGGGAVAVSVAPPHRVYAAAAAKAGCPTHVGRLPVRPGGVSRRTERGRQAASSGARRKTARAAWLSAEAGLEGQANRTWRGRSIYAAIYDHS